MIEKWIKEIKKNAPADMLGMILSHNGIVRATAKNGGKVQAMNLSYDKKKLSLATLCSHTSLQLFYAARQENLMGKGLQSS